jgi:hypothetical protein
MVVRPKNVAAKLNKIVKTIQIELRRRKHLSLNWTKLNCVQGYDKTGMHEQPSHYTIFVVIVERFKGKHLPVGCKLLSPECHIYVV